MLNWIKKNIYFYHVVKNTCICMYNNVVSIKNLVSSLAICLIVGSLVQCQKTCVSEDNDSGSIYLTRTDLNPDICVLVVSNWKCLSTIKKTQWMIYKQIYQKLKC